MRPLSETVLEKLSLLYIYIYGQTIVIIVRVVSLLKMRKKVRRNIG